MASNGTLPHCVRCKCYYSISSRWWNRRKGTKTSSADDKSSVDERLTTPLILWQGIEMKFLLVFRSSVSVPTSYFLLRRCDDRRTNVSLPRTRIVVTIEISFPAVDHETCSHGCERYRTRGNLIALSRRKRSRQIETCFATKDWCPIKRSDQDNM